MGITLQLTGIEGVSSKQLVKSSNNINVDITTQRDLKLAYGLGDPVIKPAEGQVIQVSPTWDVLGDGPLRFDVSGTAICFAFYTASNAALRVVWFSVSGPKPGSNVQTQPTVASALPTTYHQVDFPYDPDDGQYYDTMVNQMAAVIQSIPGVVSAVNDGQFCKITIGVGAASAPFIVYPDGFVIPTLTIAEQTVITVQNPGSFYDVAGVGRYVQTYAAPSAGHYFWLKVTNGANTQTVPSGIGTAHEVDILLADTIPQIATKLKAAMDATGLWTTDQNLGTSTVQFQDLVLGDCIDASAATSGFRIFIDGDNSQGGTTERPFLFTRVFSSGIPAVTLGTVTSVDFRLQQFVFDNNITNQVGAPWYGDGTVDWSFNATYRLTPKDVPNKGMTFHSQDNTTAGAFVTVNISIALFILTGSLKSDYNLGAGLFVAGETFEGSYVVNFPRGFPNVRESDTVHYHIYVIDPAWINNNGGTPFINIDGRFDKLDDSSRRHYGPFGNISLLLTYTRSGANSPGQPRYVEQAALQASGGGYDTGSLLANSPTVKLKAVSA
jgi:hypothetical protein